MNNYSGNETVKLDYDREAIGKALQKFTEDYNKTVDAAGNSNSMSVLRNGAYLTKITAAALTRGLGAKVKRTNICKIGFHLPDAVVLVGIVALFTLWILGMNGVVK